MDGETFICPFVHSTNTLSNSRAERASLLLPREEKSVDSKVNEAISDTIKEQNDYTDKDGEHFKVSTKYDVYVDSDDRYYAVDPGVPVPDSFHKLEPNEIKDY